VPVSLNRKKCVAWALSVLPAARPGKFRLGVPRIFSPVPVSNGRSGKVKPVIPTAAMSTASSSSLSGCGLAFEV
jgi:hypothetical protein